MENRSIVFDSGFYFGKGVFETILVKSGKPIFYKEHLERLNNGLRKLNINKSIEEEEILENCKGMDNIALKVMISEQNTIFTTREVPYKESHYEKGFSLDLSKIKRNESSPMVYLKSFNYMDNIIENERCKKEGFNEVIFLNTRDEIAEGSVSNIFFIMENEIITPKIECGILDGIVRKVLIERLSYEHSIKEDIIKLDDLEQCKGIFITNSLIGLMWCDYFNGKAYEECDIYREIRAKYNKLICHE